MSPEQRAELAKKETKRMAETKPVESLSVSAGEVKEETVQSLSADDLRIETAERIFVFDQYSSALQSVKLKNYKESMTSESVVELLDGPMTIQGSMDPVGRKALKGFQAKREGQSVTFWKQQDQFLVEQKITVPAEGYGLGVELSFTNTSSNRADLNATLLVKQDVSITEESSSFGPAAFMAQNKGFIYGLDGSREEELAKAYCEDPDGNAFNLGQGNIDFIGFDNHYFLSVLRSEQEMSYEMGRDRGNTGSSICPMSLVAYQKQGLVDPGQKVTLKFSG